MLEECTALRRHPPPFSAAINTPSFLLPIGVNLDLRRGRKASRHLSERIHFRPYCLATRRPGNKICSEVEVLVDIQLIIQLFNHAMHGRNDLLGAFWLPSLADRLSLLLSSVTHET